MSATTPETKAHVHVLDTSATPCFSLRTSACLADIRESKALGISMDQPALEILAELHDVPVPILESESSPEGRAASAARIQGRSDARAAAKAAQAEAAARATATARVQCALSHVKQEAGRLRAKLDKAEALAAKLAVKQTEQAEKLAVEERAEESRRQTFLASHARRRAAR